MAVRALGLGVFMLVGCATGGLAIEDGGTGTDSGGHDGGVRDTGSSKDSGGSQDHYVAPDTGGPACGGACLGSMTCCNNTCVDTTSDPNNCGACGTPCGTESCCSSTCTDTMGTDVNNCGGCGVTCAGTCTGGVCQTTSTCTEDLGSCSHSVCVTGGALPVDCDLSDNDTTFCVCDLFGDTACCSSTWSATCVSEAIVFCGEPCTDPGC